MFLFQVAWLLSQGAKRLTGGLIPADNIQMELAYFEPNHLRVVDEAVGLAEDVASNFFKFSSADWKAVPYDVKTLKDLAREEMVSGVFAQVRLYQRDLMRSPSGIGRYEYYKICVHDHEILKALERDEGFTLFPLVLYVVTHELVHIARFKHFLRSFYASEVERIDEERRVHQTTFDILKNIPVSGMKPVLKRYQMHCISHGIKEVR